MGIRGSPTAELVFDDVRVPAANLLGAEGDGFSIAMKTFDRSRPGIAAQAVGIAQGALEVAAKLRPRAAPVRARRRRVPDDLGDAGRHGRGHRVGPTGPLRGLRGDRRREPGTRRAGPSLAKLVAGDAAMRVTTDAVQVLGGYGYVDEYPVERMMRDAKITQIYEGTQQIQRLVVARALLG